MNVFKRVTFFSLVLTSAISAERLDQTALAMYGSAVNAIGQLAENVQPVCEFAKEKVTEAFKLILSDENVKGIFVNIFGGIMKCDVIAEGIVAATKEVGLELPLVVRLEGTNVDAGKQILKDSGLAITAATSMADGAEKNIFLNGLQKRR